MMHHVQIQPMKTPTSNFQCYLSKYLSICVHTVNVEELHWKINYIILKRPLKVCEYYH